MVVWYKHTLSIQHLFIMLTEFSRLYTITMFLHLQPIPTEDGLLETYPDCTPGKNRKKQQTRQNSLSSAHPLHERHSHLDRRRKMLRQIPLNAERRGQIVQHPRTRRYDESRHDRDKVHAGNHEAACRGTYQRIYHHYFVAPRGLLNPKIAEVAVIVDRDDREAGHQPLCSVRRRRIQFALHLGPLRQWTLDDFPSGTQATYSLSRHG